MSVLGWYLIIGCAIGAAGSNFLLRISIKQVTNFRFNLASFVSLGMQPLFLLGALLYAMATIGWLRVVATEPLSLAYPIMISATFFLITLGAAVFFHENLNLHNFFGLGLIIAGIYFVGR